MIFTKVTLSKKELKILSTALGEAVAARDYKERPKDVEKEFDKYLLLMIKIDKELHGV